MTEQVNVTPCRISARQRITRPATERGDIMVRERDRRAVGLSAAMSPCADAERLLSQIAAIDELSRVIPAASALSIVPGICRDARLHGAVRGGGETRAGGDMGVSRHQRRLMLMH